jgi:outer membrane protein assembly factor BamB
MPTDGLLLTTALVVVMSVGVAALVVGARDVAADGRGRGSASASTDPAWTAPATPSAPSPDAAPLTPGDSDPAGGQGAVEPIESWRAPWMVPAPGSLLHGSRYGDVDGFLVFRGNPTRTYYGEGPVPREPAVAWSSPSERMCSVEELEDERKIWCGIGWTGQVVLIDHGGDGITAVEVMVGGYDGAFHLFDGATGERTRAPFVTGGMVKGTESLDPDGFPLAYVGSRDGYLRVLALDRDRSGAPRELWRLGRHPEGVWNDDWDANPTILDDVLYAGGEDSWFRMWRLNRDYDAQGRVTVEPELLVEVPGFDDALFTRIGDRNVSIESSPAITADRVYWANSGGRVMGIDRLAALEGRVVITFDHWVGDDVDASIVVDRDGMLIVAVEEERRLPAAAGMGQLIRLDPSRPADPVLWRLDIPAVPGVPGADGGVWATPALYGDLVYVPTHSGRLLVVDLADGTVVSNEFLGGPLWSSPAIVEEPGGPAWLIQATCGRPSVRGYSLEDPASPQLRWTVPMPGCIEATPVVWRGSIYVGTRDGRLHALR